MTVSPFGGSRSATRASDQDANRVGHTNATSGSDAVSYGPVTSLGNLSIGNSGGTNWYAVVVEIRV